MRFRSTLILLLVLIGLGAYVYFVEVPKPDPDKKEALFSGVKSEDVSELQLDYADRKIHLKKNDGQWRLTEPIESAADASAVDGVINTATTAEIKKKLEGGSGDLARYGLDKPLVTLTLKVGDKELTPVSVGKEAPVGGSVYVLRKDEPSVLLSSSSLRLGLDKQVKDLRDKKILTVADDDLRSIEIHSDRKDIRLVKDGDTWKLERPEAFKGDDSAIRTLVSSIRALRVVDFVDDNPSDLKKLGLDAPRLKLTLGLKDDSVRTIAIGDKKEGGTDVYIQTSDRPSIYTISDSSYRNLDKSDRDLRDKMILAFEQDKAVKIEVSRKDSEPFSLVKGDDGKWQIEGEQTPVTDTVAEQFVTDLHELKGYEIVADNAVNLAELGLAAPKLRIAVSGKDGSLGTVIVGTTDAADGTKHFNTMLEGGPTVYLLRSYLFSRIDKGKDAFLNKPTPAPTPANASAP